MLARCRYGKWYIGLLRFLIIVYLPALSCAQIVQHCDQEGVQGVQAVIDEAMLMAQNAVLSAFQPTIRIQTLWYALILDPNYCALALGMSLVLHSFQPHSIRY
jgi:hypothetical protein